MNLATCHIVSNFRELLQLLQASLGACSGSAAAWSCPRSSWSSDCTPRPRRTTLDWLIRHTDWKNRAEDRSIKFFCHFVAALLAAFIRRWLCRVGTITVVLHEQKGFENPRSQKVIQATTALFVFLSSSLATFQFALKNQVLLTSLYFSKICLVAHAISKWRSKFHQTRN